MGVPFVTPQSSVSLILDVSNIAWGAHLNNFRTWILWSQEGTLPAHKHQEFRAVYLACQMFLPQVSGKSVQVLTDNTAARFCVNKQGWTRSSAQYQKTGHLWEFCARRSVHLQASHLLGAWNVLADNQIHFPKVGASPGGSVRH